MALKKIKINDLPLVDSLKGLFTIGTKIVDGIQTSVKVSLEHIQTAYENAVTAASKANSAASSANGAASSANSAASSANTAAGKANAATNAANEAAVLANEKATAADTAAGRVNNAIEQANTAATAAQQQASAAQQAAESAADKIEEMDAGLERLEELEDTLTAQVRQQPTSMALEYPKKITQGNKGEHRITATLSPAGTGSNVIFLGDDKIVSVAPDGFIVVNGLGKSRIHVIPTENTSIYQTIEIEVTAQSLRLNTKTSLRLISNGNLRFN